MTDAKKLKRKIRDRASRTGESYAAARRHVLVEVDRARAERTAEAASTARSQPAGGAVTEARCIEVTGHGFDHWFSVLDRFRATHEGHAAAARHLQQHHALSAWYAQSITVQYERARGLRQANEAPGGFQVSVSRTLPGAISDTRRFLSDEDVRESWLALLDGPEDDLRAALRAGPRTKADAVWVRFVHDEGRVELRIHGIPDGRSRVVARVERLPDPDAVARQRASWRRALDALKETIAK